MTQSIGHHIDRRFTIEVCRSKLLSPEPGSAEPRRDFEVVIRTRADVKTMAGRSAFAQVDIGGERVTHVFAIRYTTVPFDVRHVVRDPTGMLYRILSVDDRDLSNREIKISCVSLGHESQNAARA